MNLPEKTYTETELTRAKTASKVVGWMQGAGVVFGGAVLWNLLGWIPLVIGLVAVGKTYDDMRLGLEMIGLRDEDLRQAGVRVYKLALTFPIEPHFR